MRLQQTLHYLPTIAYFYEIEKYEQFFINENEIFQKQTLRNRTFILGPHQVERLVVPVYEANKQLPLKEIRIDYSESWLKVHLKTIENCYRKAPFFEFYFPYFEQILQKKEIFLIDLNQNLLSICLKMLQVQVPICRFSEPLEAFKRLNFKNSTDFGAEYDFEPYQQNFGNNFVQNLSVLDVLFCKGSESLDIISKTCRR